MKNTDGRTDKHTPHCVLCLNNAKILKPSTVDSYLKRTNKVHPIKADTETSRLFRIREALTPDLGPETGYADMLLAVFISSYRRS
jgi:hypothetical protein